ncbi:hypothetical protein ACFSX5_12760 [Devosia albogilva]|uniref:Carbon monoxide dehydrogenase n=1 Tax=Devosia albogilva TaxID=429726 RepID=A0ABW5QM33_9HYPH
MAASENKTHPPAATPDADEARARNRRRRSWALAAALVLFALTFYALTIVKMGPALFERAL